MKYRKLLLATGALVIIASAVAKILHLPFAYLSNTIISLVSISMLAIQSLYVKELEKKIGATENNSVPDKM